MSAPRLHYGGLMRCCTRTWDEKVMETPQYEGSIINCNWCGSSMIMNFDEQNLDGVWEWNHEF